MPTGHYGHEFLQWYLMSMLKGLSWYLKQPTQDTPQCVNLQLL